MRIHVLIDNFSYNCLIDTEEKLKEKTTSSRGRLIIVPEKFSPGALDCGYFEASPEKVDDLDAGESAKVGYSKLSLNIVSQFSTGETILKPCFL